jgi:hypothetical protein
LRRFPTSLLGRLVEVEQEFAELGEDYFREVAAILDAAAGGLPDFTALGEVMRSHGISCAE